MKTDKAFVYKSKTVAFLNNLVLNNPGVKLILQTANGLVSGTPVNDADQLENPYNDILKQYEQFHEHQLVKSSDEENKNAVMAGLFLKDVSIQDGMHLTTLPFLVVFATDIIGVSVGTT